MPLSHKKESAFIYWIKHPNHKDITTEGYVGVSKNPKERIRHHFKNAKYGYHSDKVISKAINKYGSENLIVEIVLKSYEDYCYMIEKKLRPLNFIGWNMTVGGYHTPNHNPKGSKLSKDIIKKAQDTIKKRKQNGEVLGNQRKVSVNNEIFNSIKEAREKFNISKTQMTRLLKIKPKYKNMGNNKFSHLDIKYAN